MSDAHSSNQAGKRIFVKHITNHSVCFALKETTFWPACDDSASILATVLQEGQTLRNFRRGVNGRVVQQ